MVIHPKETLQVLTIVSLANYAHILFKRLLGTRFDAAIDGGVLLRDGHAILGRSKTWRGIAAAVLVSTCASVFLNLEWRVGTVAGAFAMGGDCLSSFAKRRLGIEPGDMSIGLDQLPESLLPALACSFWLPLSLFDVAIIALLFFVGQVVFSRLLFTIGLRDRPY
jgi:CDP-2,3-bis-(O-geranylgeranyl)-sn-glycerol synthase